MLRGRSQKGRRVLDAQVSRLVVSDIAAIGFSG